MWTPIASDMELPLGTVEDIYWQFHRDSSRATMENGPLSQGNENSRLSDHPSLDENGETEQAIDFP